MKREITDELLYLIKDQSDHRVIILEGARQVGKSYLLNDVLKKVSRSKAIFDLEKNRKFKWDIDATEDFYDFKTLLKDQYGVLDDGILFVDEAQESRRLASYIKSFKEDWPTVKVVLTGSSMNRFFGPDVRIPVGRIRSLCLFGFSFAEFVEMVKGTELADLIRSSPEKVPESRHQLLLKLFDNYLSVGGYPESVIAFAAGKPYTEITAEIMALLEEDFERKEAYQPELFRNIISSISNNIGSPSKLTHFNTSKYQAKKALAAMKSWHLVLEVEPHSLDPMRSNYLPKRYLHDLGVLNQSRAIVAPQLSILNTIDPLLRTPLGGIFENAVLISMLSSKSAKHHIGTWKKGNSTSIEVDFIFDTMDKKYKIPIECKATTTLKGKHYKNLVHYLRLTNQNVGVCVTAAPLQELEVEGKFRVINLPVYLASANNITKYISGS